MDDLELSTFQKKQFDQCKITSLSLLEEVVDVVNKNKKIFHPHSCQESILNLQNKKLSLSQYRDRVHNWNTQYNKALSRAVYSHDWDGLLNLLCASPIWEHYHKTQIYSKDNYLKAMLILLLNHPSVRLQSTLEEFLHLVLNCRNENDRKAFLKVLNTLPDKLKMRNSYLKNMNHKDYSDEISVQDEIEMIAEFS